MDITTKKTMATVGHTAAEKTLEEWLYICKPLSVKMTRLPMSVVDEYMRSSLATEVTTKKRLSKPRYRQWRYGYASRNMQRRQLYRKKTLQLRVSEAEAKNKNIEEEKFDAVRISESEIFNFKDLDESSSGQKEATSVCGDQTNLNGTQPETPGSGSLLIENEASSVTELEQNIPTVPAAAIDNCSPCSILRDTGKRKRPSESNDDEAESNRFMQDSKKSKSLVDEVSREIVAKRVKPAKIKKHNPKSVRRQVNDPREARIFLRRLEDSLDPLVRRWTEKWRLFDGAVATTTSQLEKNIDEVSRLESTDELSKQESPNVETSGLPTISDLEASNSSKATTVTVACDVPASTNVTPLIEGTKTSGTSTAHDEATDDKNDEETMEFQRSPRKIIPPIDSSNSDTTSCHDESRKTPSVPKITRTRTVIGSSFSGISDAEEMATIRSSSRNTKTPLVTKSSSETTRPETRMSHMLRLANISTVDVADPKSSRDNHSETSKSLRSRRENRRKTSSLRLSLTRSSMDSEASISVIERPLDRKNTSRYVIDDSSSESTYNPGEALTDMFDDDVPSPMRTQNGSDDVTTEEETNPPDDRRIDDDNNEVKAMTEVNCDASPVDDSSESPRAPSSQRDEVLKARKKLTALNAMVVLTRLEDLDDISEDNKYSETEMELRTAEDSEWPRERSEGTMDDVTSRDSPRVDPNFNEAQTPDPLDTNKEDDRDSASETITPFAAVFCRTLGKLRGTEVAPTRSSPRKLPRVDYYANEDVDSSWPQDPESDVELSLVLEESKRTLENSIEGSQTSGIGDSSMNSLCESSEAVVTARVNSDAPRRVNENDDLDEEVHRCVTCNDHFENAELLEQHRSSSAGCKPVLSGSACQTSCETSSEPTQHERNCGEKLSENGELIEEAASNKTKTDNGQTVPENYALVWLLSKTDPKKSSKKGTKKFRKILPRVGGDNPICNVCSENFGTTQALSEHIYKHSPEELQAAYRACKAKMMADFEMTEAASETNGVVSGGFVNGPTSTEGRNATQSLRGTGVVTAVDREALAAMVCPCHRQIHPNTDENDLQIEMVLVCQHCQVLFRRRECLEVHYRTSPRCANDRSRGRWPRMFCASCQLTLNNWADMRHHLEVHASANADGTVRFVCNICRVVFVGFGALFYYHWFSHLKDTMLVASRHSFPKISVQPIDGMAKLPIGASPDESYIWVAEHVCTVCKKPFSTRRDLEVHRETHSCAKTVNVEIRKDPNVTNDSQWYCDVCDVVFADRDELNDHGAKQHGRRYTCVSTSPRQKTFMCTKCCAMRKRVKDIEEHWKSHPQDNSCHFAMENRPISVKLDDNDEVAVISPLVRTNEVVENSEARESERRDSPSDDSVTKSETSRDESRSCEAEATKRTAERTDAVPSIDNVFQTAVENLESRINVVVANEKSSNVEPRADVSAKKFESLILCNLLTESPSAAKNIEMQKTRIGALEDPLVNVVMSDSSKEKLSASLVIDESRETTAESPTESYRILMMDNNPKSNSGPIKMVFARKGAGNSVDKRTQPRTIESKEEKVSSKSTTMEEEGVKEVAEKSSQKRETVAGSTNERASETTSKKKNDDSSRKPESKETKLTLPAASNDRGGPEIIDIVDVTEEENQVTTEENSTSQVTSANAKVKPSVESVVSSVIKLPEGVESMKIGSMNSSLGSRKKSSLNDSSGSDTISSLNESDKSDNSDGSSLARREPRLSFEEARYAAQFLSKSANADDVAVAKKQGFLRVKNLSELQAVRQHVCPLCSATFESHASLDEHKQLHHRNSVGKVVGTNPKGMTAALVLPDYSESPKTPVVVPSRNVTRTLSQSHISQRFAAIKPAPSMNTAGVVGPMESWILNANQQNKPATAPLTLNVTNGVGTVRSKNNVNTDATKTMITSTASISQPQQSFVVQAQPVNTIIGYLTLPDVNRQLPESRNTGQMGYHILPAMVAPSAQGNRQHIAVASQQNSSSNNLPTSGLAVVSPLTQQHPQVPQKFICTICRTFRSNSLNALNDHVNKHLFGFNNTVASQNTNQPSISTVILPQASSYATVNQIVSNPITDNTTAATKTTGERLVVNNWILSNPSSLWTTSNFNPQSGSSVVPITTQSHMPSTVQNVNENNTNPPKSSLPWSATTYNPAVLPSANTIIKGTLASPTIQNSNNNNNSTGASKQSPAWSGMTFNASSNSNGGQIVYQCTICKSSTYTDHEHLRRHVLIVHGAENFLKCGIVNVQKSYFCSRCPNGTATFDSQSKLRIHQETDHSNACPSCHQNFCSFKFLSNHMEHCRTRNTLANFDSNC